MDRSIDLNCDLGESFGAWRLGDDAAMFALVSSANIACGFHAGDAQTMRASVRLALEHGVAVGAHPGYRDLAGFGRRALGASPDEIAGELAYQLGALFGSARLAGGSDSGARVRYVKAHGALYHRLGGDHAAATAFADTVATFDETLVVLGAPGTELQRASDAAGLTFATEAFVDRAYLADGSLMPRTLPGAVVHDPAAAADRALELAESGSIAADDGSRVELAPDSLCVHGDTPGAAAIAAAVRAALDRAGATVESFA